MNKIILFIALIGFAACQKSKESELEILNTKLMKLHDEVMPQTMRLSELKKTLLENPTDKAQAMSGKLQKAEDDMYTWMEDYGKVLNEEKDEIKKLAKYKELLKTVSQIKTDTKAAIDSAKVIATP